MNIKEAKEQIKNAMTAYFTKDEMGNYMIPIEKQRPVFLMGPPGVGKTAVMEQVAAEMGVGLLSYSMTHHTRQSALGLPFIVHKNYGGEEFDVSEYTMSEIISSVYELMEETGIREGILFLDEINCVSETLAPIMLQFLQYKIFGRHRVPDGWIVVTAGNPPEYNNSVREFDIVTWDRLKRIDVEPDFAAWKEYAYKAGVHASVLTYLEIRKGDFYSVESTVDGKSFITARGWEDLSQMIILYEKNNIKVDEKLIGQYIQNKKIAKSFASYYDLFNKYKSDYQVNDILDGNATAQIKDRAKNARFDERLSLLGLLLDGCMGAINSTMDMEGVITEIMPVLKQYKQHVSRPGADAGDELNKLIEGKRTEIVSGKKSGALSTDAQRIYRLLINFLEKILPEVNGKSGAESFKTIKGEFDKFVKELKKQAAAGEGKLTNAFAFIEECFTEGQEMIIFITELTANPRTSKFIGKFGCKEYYKHNKELLFHDRQKEIIAQIKELED